MRERERASVDNASSSGRFGIAQAFVIVTFVAAAVILSLVAHMEVQDVALLLAAAGGVGVAVLVAANVKNRSRGLLLRRVLNAVLTPGSGS
ncbi:hypothetical protein [Streptomyces agglomeratus]|uniref:hypothetical protein n=1 Tax=Streptomyces agglomeratus TaxID=285458 RepID=UPI0008541385|nr:hypothetical protein [Streptomyces agglomeratus]OEJ49663.1 hypothetical protein BGK72_01440 [Streptomyces agglomeratus]